MAAFPTPIQYRFEIPCKSSKTRERNKSDSNAEEVKLFLFSDDMILYLKYPKISTKKLLEIINLFGKAARYKIKKTEVSSLSMYQQGTD
jgi:hypothetical protein